MRTILAAVALVVGLSACSGSKKDDNKEESKLLKVGDAAPPLTVSKWMNGEKISSFEPGKVYVVEFWATWCGPCIAMMPHLADLQKEYQDKGLVVIATTTIDRRNPERAVKDFIMHRGEKTPFRFALCNNSDMDDAYRGAAGVSGLPATFVVGRDGKIAYIGRPMFLDDVLPKVMAGTWKGKEDADIVAGLSEDFEALNEKVAAKPQDTLRYLASFEEKYPAKKTQPAYQVMKVLFLLQASKYDEAKAVTEELLPSLVQTKKLHLLNDLRSFWASEDVNPDRKYVNLAIKAADAGIEIDPKDPMVLIGAAEAYYAAGNKGRAIELAEKVLKSAKDNEDLIEFAKEEIEKFKGGKK